MSKLYAKAFIWAKSLEKSEIREAEQAIPAKVRYLRKTKEFHFQCLDALTWLMSDPREQEIINFKIKEEYISRFFRFDVFLKETVIEETDYREVKKQEMTGIDDFYDDQYVSLCFLQNFYYLSKDIVKEIKRRAHVWALGKTKSPWYSLSMIPLNKHGGRPFKGMDFSHCYLTKEDRERLLDNLDRYDSIIKKCAASDVSLERFVYMHKEFAKLGNLLPEWMKRPFMKREEGLKWYWHAVRYSYKKANGLILEPSAEEIRKYQKRYGFPFDEKE